MYEAYARAYEAYLTTLMMSYKMKVTELKLFCINIVQSLNIKVTNSHTNSLLYIVLF